MSCSTLELYSGERRVVSVEFSTCDGSPFVIRDASYALEYGDEIEASGTPMISDSKLTMTIEPKRTGRYSLSCKIKFADEIVIRSVPVIVRKN